MCKPKTLYKYVTADRALTCIPEVGDGTLRATQPAALNDPFECGLFVAGSKAAEGDSAMAAILSAINAKKPVTEQDVRDAKAQQDSLFLGQLFTDRISTKLGFVSFSASPFHPLMWAHYTENGSGFVIGYDAGRLEHLQGSDGSLRRVQYNQTKPLIQTPEVLERYFEDLPALLAWKGDYWSYEAEWRLIVELSSTIGTGLHDPLGQPINLVRVPNEAVTEVYYTERTPTETVDTVERRLSDDNNRYGTNAPRKLLMSNVGYVYYDPTPSD